jgi:hypothetical protein
MMIDVVGIPLYFFTFWIVNNVLLLDNIHVIKRYLANSTPGLQI